MKRADKWRPLIGGAITAAVSPLFESEKVPATWYSTIYYAFLSFASLLAGYVSTVVLMLYDTLSDMIEAVGLGREDHPLVDDGPPEGAPVAE